MSIASIAEPARTNLYDSRRYRSTLLIGIALYAFSTLVIWLVSQSAVPSMSGAPTYLFSIPSPYQEGNTKYALSSPLAVAIYEDKIAVADSGEGKVKIYDQRGRYLEEVDLGRLGGGRRKRAYPTALAYDYRGRLFVAEIINDRIYVFDPWLQLLDRFPRRGQRTKLMQPVALTVHDDQLFVTDVGDSSIKVFGLDGSFTREFASREVRKVDLAFPNGIGVDSTDRVHVADSNNHKVIAFSPAGRQLFEYDFEFILPRGLAVDALDRVHVVDTFARRIDAFDRGGRFLFSYGSATQEGGAGLEFPNGIGIDSAGARVYIADRGANRVQVWGWP